MGNQLQRKNRETQDQNTSRIETSVRDRLNTNRITQTQLDEVITPLNKGNQPKTLSRFAAYQTQPIKDCPNNDLKLSCQMVSRQTMCIPDSSTRYIEKLVKDTRMKVSGWLYTPEFAEMIRKKIYRALGSTFQSPADRESPEFKALKSTVDKIEDHELCSIFAYMKSETDLVGMMNRSANIYQRFIIISSRISRILFKKFRKNLFLRIVRVYDQVIFVKYFQALQEILKATTYNFKYTRKVKNYQNDGDSRGLKPLCRLIFLFLIS